MYASARFKNFDSEIFLKGFTISWKSYEPVQLPVSNSIAFQT